MFSELCRPNFTLPSELHFAVRTSLCRPNFAVRETGMRIVLASSEAVPFSKTGGLADVAGALSKALADAGHDVTLMIPSHRRVQSQRDCPEIHDTEVVFDVPVGNQAVPAHLYWSSLPGSKVRVILVDQPNYFDRQSLYQQEGVAYRDNCERFVFFSRAVLEATRRLAIQPDIIHANDWQTGLVPALLEIEGRRRTELAHTASVFTIHNMAFQGNFWHWDMLLTGLDWKYYNWKQMESYGQLNLLKTGLVFATKLTTVSPTYAGEIRSSEAGCGLEGVLESRSEDLSGILNGIDPEEWNPATDPFIRTQYSADTFVEGKAACKHALQRRMGLPESDVPMFGMVSRMTDQKGFDLIADRANELLERDLQMVFLGTGDARYEQLLEGIAARCPDKVAVRVGFDETLAHQIEAASDVYLMPSRFEPCGLNQMYSLAYGAVPIVRGVGGLADTVTHASDANIKNGSATGFVFEGYSSSELMEQIDRALKLYADREKWDRIVTAGMTQDWTWSRSAQQYIELYEQAIQTVASR